MGRLQVRDWVGVDCRVTMGHIAGHAVMAPSLIAQAVTAWTVWIVIRTVTGKPG